MTAASLKGKRLINLDSEAEGSLWISCAGGLSGISTIPVQRVEAEGQKAAVKITGLMGGHSGAEIDKKRANANVLMGRFLYSTSARELLMRSFLWQAVRRTMPLQEKQMQSFLWRI